MSYYAVKFTQPTKNIHLELSVSSSLITVVPLPPLAFKLLYEYRASLLLNLLLRKESHKFPVHNFADQFFFLRL